MNLSTDSVDKTVDNANVSTPERVQMRVSYACSNFRQGPNQRLMTVKMLANLSDRPPAFGQF